MRLAVFIALAAGCVMPPPVGPFVRNFTVDGNVLVIDRCFLDSSGLELTNCTTEHRPIGPPPTSLPVTLDGGQILEGISSQIRHGVMQCGATHRIGGVIALTVTINPDGGVSSVIPSRGSERFAGCLRDVFVAARFATSQRGARVEIPMPLPPIAEPAP